MKSACEDNVFMVSGYIGVSRSKDSQFLGYCVAKDKASAIRLMAQTVPDLNPLGVTSLAEMSRQVAVLQDVMSGRVKAPVERGLVIDSAFTLAS